MSRRITYKLSGRNLDAALKFASDLGMDLNQLAERSLFYAMKQAYRNDAPAAGSDEEYTYGRYPTEESSSGEQHLPPARDFGEPALETPDREAGPAGSDALADTADVVRNEG